MRGLKLPLVMAIVWPLVGVLTTRYKGAMFAAVLGLIMMAFMAVSFIRNWDEDEDVANPYARVLALIVFWFSFPFALLMWGNQTAHGAAALWILFWFTAAAVLIRLVAYGFYLLEKKFGSE